MQLENSRVLLVGGTRGLGFGAARILSERGARVVILARTNPARCAVESSMTCVNGDARDPQLAARLIADHKPDAILVAAGTPPVMGSIEALSWEDFEANWHYDTRIAFTWVQAVLKGELPDGAQTILVSSGAALSGSPMSGGYAGSKFTVMMLSRYGMARAAELGRNLSFRCIVPHQMAPGTGTGEAGAAAYAAKARLTREEFFARFGAPLTPEFFGRAVAEMLEAQMPMVNAYRLTTAAGLQPLPA